MKRSIESERTIHEEGYRFTEPGELTHAHCHVCGESCHIERDVTGPTGFAPAMAKRATLHDRVVCPHGTKP